MFQVEDSVPTEDEIESAVKRFRKFCSGRPSGMRADNLKRWLEEVRKEEAAAEKTTAAEGVVTVIGGPWGGGDRGEEGDGD